MARILESIIGSTDADAERYRTILEDALRAGDLPKKLKKPIAKATILTLAELEADAEEMSSSEEDDDDDDEKVDLAPPAEVATARAAAASDEPSSDLLAMFASRRAERQQGFDAFAAKWERISAEEEAAAPKKKSKKRR